MKKITLFIISILLVFYINLTYSDLNKAFYDGNQPNYCATLTKSDATKYDFYKCAYFEKIKEKNKTHIPTQAELYQKRLKESTERERKRNKKVLDNINRVYELEWNNKINDLKKVWDLIKLNSLEAQLVKEWNELFNKNNCKVEKDCIDAIYNLKYAIVINNYIIETDLDLKVKDASPFINNQIQWIYWLMIYEYIKKSDYNKVIEYALLLNNKKEKDNFLAIAYSWLAYDYYKTWEYNSSIEYSLLADSKQYKDKWYIYYIIWLSSYELEEYKNALFYFEKSLINTDDEENIKVLKKNIKISNNKIKEIQKVNIKEPVVIKEPNNDKQCKSKNWINSYFDNKWYCLCKEWFEFSESSWYTTCDIKQSLLLRSKIDKKILVKLDRVLPKLLLKPEKTLIKLRNKINLLLEKKLNNKTYNILLYIKLIINDKISESFNLDDFLN